MMSTLSSRDRRALTLGAAALTVLLTLNLVLRPLLARMDELSSAIAEEQSLLSRELELLGAMPSLEEGLELGGKRLHAARPKLFDGSTEGLASAYLAEYVQEAAESRSTLISRLDPGGVESLGGGFETVSAIVHGESDLEGFLTLLYLLEGGEKLVQVSDLSIRTTRSNPASPPPMEVISFEMRVTGVQLDLVHADEEPSREATREEER